YQFLCVSWSLLFLCMTRIDPCHLFGFGYKSQTMHLFPRTPLKPSNETWRTGPYNLSNIPDVSLPPGFSVMDMSSPFSVLFFFLRSLLDPSSLSVIGTISASVAAAGAGG